MTRNQWCNELALSDDIERKLKLLGENGLQPSVRAALARVETYASTFAKAQRAIRRDKEGEKK
jgi:hypothetical protein